MEKQESTRAEYFEAASAGTGSENVRKLVLTGLMTALVLAATSFFRIPVAATNGYIHLGDAMVFMAVIILRKKNGTIAAASGSALADLLGGYGHWVPWTFVIKGLMALVTGIVLAAAGRGIDNSGSEKQYSPLAGGIAMTAGSLVMISGYFLAQRVIYGTLAAPLAALPGNIVQAAAGIALAELLSAALYKAAPQLLK